MSSTLSETKLPRKAAESVRSRLEDVAGGPARTRVVVIFACVLGLESADLATVGAAAPQLEHAFRISYGQLGLVAAVATMVGAIATVPAGALADRVSRTRMLASAVALWALAMALSAAAQSYGWLLLSRVGLGAVTAVAAPTIASLTGDLFPAGERGKIYGYVLSGELIGAAVGFVISGSVAGALSWRWAFGILTVPAAALAVVIWRGLPEPARGGQSRLQPGADHIPDASEAKSSDEIPRDGEAVTGIARRAVVEHRVTPVRDHVMREDPATMRLRRAVVYVLQIKTNRWLIAATAIGYFFFAGLRTFALVFVRGHFGVSQTSATAVLFVAGLGSIGGVLIAGRLADRLIRDGRLDARLLVGGVAYVLAALVLVPALTVRELAVALPALLLAGAALSAPNPPLDAARLDLVPSRLWGRAEGVRTVLRQSAQAAAPLVFGLLADALGGGAVSASSSQAVVSNAATKGLEYAFVIMLVPLALNGLILLRARRSYPADVATAIASEGRGGRD